MELTPKYGLKKPSGNDYGDIAALNANMDVVDSALDGLETGKASLDPETGHVKAGQLPPLPPLDYIPTAEKGAAGGVATLGADKRVPAEQLPSLNYIPTAEKGVPNGVATLGADGKVPAEQLRASADSLNYGPDGTDGLWDRQTTAPTGTQPIRYNGDLRARRVYGMYYSDGADYAEAYALDEELSPGELVAIGPGGALVRNRVRGNVRVLGIVSTAPGAVIGGDGTPIALMGRVPARVAGPVRAGELLMGSALAGALEKAGTDAARGAIVAQALEDGDGVVSVLVLRL